MLKAKLALIAAATALVVAVPATPGVAAPRADADWTEHYFPMGDATATTLHADVLRPKGMDASVRTPVILVVTPYANHAGSTATDFSATAQGPHERFYDFLNLSGALTKGYTFAYVDLPGFGGSGGCNDWGGPREQLATKAAVEWAASQTWSNGKVALLGKSYDGWTGLMGITRQPQGLAAVVSLEPVFSGYRYLYNNGVRFQNTAATISSFQVNDAKPGTINDTPQYHANGAPQAWCYAHNSGLSSASDEETGPYWLERYLQIGSTGEDTPLFLTQGFLEANTKPDAAFDYWNSLDLTNSRAWFGQFDHCRAWETASACGSAGGGGAAGRLAVGRAGFMDEVMRFLDLHLKGIQPSVQDPKVEVQDNRGLWRAETMWPPEDMSVFWSDLNGGTYTDGGSTQLWSFSSPLEHDVWLAGEPTLKVEIDAARPRANLVANVFDVSPAGDAVLINRGAYLLREQGTQFAAFDLYGQDWRIPAGHRVGVVISDNDIDSSGWWLNVPTQQTVTVRSARIGLPFLYFERDPEEYLAGGSTPKLEGHYASDISVSAETISAGERTLNLPGPLVERPDEEEEEPQQT